MEEEPRTTTTGNEGKKKLVVSVGGISTGGVGGIAVAGVIFFGGIIVTAAAAFSFLSRRRRDTSGNRDGRRSLAAISVEDDDEEKEEEDLKKDFGIGLEQDMDQNLLRFDLIISSPVRLNHFGEIKEMKLVTCIFRNGSSYAIVDDSDAVSEEGFFRSPEKKGRLEFNCRNDEEEEEEFPLLLLNIVENSIDGEQEIKSFTIPLPDSGNIKEVLFQPAPENLSICHDGDEYAMSIEVKEKDEELDLDGDIGRAHIVSEITETEERLDSVLEDQIGQDNGTKLDDSDSDIAILISEEIQDNGSHDQMLHENDQDQHHSATNEPKPDLILESANGCNEEVQKEKFVKMQQVMLLGEFNNNWISEKGLQKMINVSDKSNLTASLIERHTWQLAEQSERTTNSHRRSVLVFTVLVLSGSLRVWYSSRPLLNLLLMHFRNYIMVKLHIMYRNHGRNHLRFRLVPKMLGI